MITRNEAFALLDRLRASGLRGVALRLEAMDALFELDGYDWCGVYRLQGDTLVLDRYVGAPTDHTEIPVGRGVCGTAIAEDRNQVVADVREVQNYLACSAQTRSELVVLIRGADGVLGQIDIDGHRVGTFDESDEALLGEIGALLAARWED